jgi:hypothetical protein
MTFGLEPNENENENENTNFLRFTVIFPIKNEWHLFLL